MSVNNASPLARLASAEAALVASIDAAAARIDAVATSAIDAAIARLEASAAAARARLEAAAQRMREITAGVLAGLDAFADEVTADLEAGAPAAEHASMPARHTHSPAPADYPLGPFVPPRQEGPQPARQDAPTPKADPNPVVAARAACEPQSGTDNAIETADQTMSRVLLSREQIDLCDPAFTVPDAKAKAPRRRAKAKAAPTCPNCGGTGWVKGFRCGVCSG